MPNECDLDYYIRIDTRLAGQLRRYHTWPIIGQQTIAEHTWNMMRIYLCVADKIDHNIVNWIQFHDIGEMSVGDLPFPVKRDNPFLKEATDNLEHRASQDQLKFWNAPSIMKLTNQEKQFCKLIELTEMAEFGLDQVCLGNSHGLVIADRCLEFIYKNNPTFHLIQYVIKRLKIFSEQMEFKLAWGELDEWWIVHKWEELNVSK